MYRPCFGGARLLEHAGHSNSDDEEYRDPSGRADDDADGKRGSRVRGDSRRACGKILDRQGAAGTISRGDRCLT